MALPMAAQLKNADRMIARVHATPTGIELSFVDGCAGTVPFQDIPELSGFSDLAGLELPNAYEVLLHTQDGEVIEIPWDFARHYCDADYRPRVELIAANGREAIGARIRRLREAATMTQADLAMAARVGRVTLVRIEHGDQSPRHETLLALASALGIEPSSLLAPAGVGQSH